MSDDNTYVWLIERVGPEPYENEARIGWTADAYEAHRYATKQDADDQRLHRGYKAESVEHGFIPPLGVDLRAIDRLLAPDHRDDDQPCSCDECMAYGAEDEGADWYRIPPANRIVMRILDGGDDRLAPLHQAFADHEAACRPAPTLDTPEPPSRSDVAPSCKGRDAIGRILDREAEKET